MAASRTGSLYCLTFRDPNPARSLGVYGTLEEFINGFASGGDVPLDGFIISTIAGGEPLMSPSAKGKMADDNWLSGYRDEDRIRIRREMLDTKTGDLAELGSTFKDMAEHCTVCVAGPAAALANCEDLEVVPL